MSADDHDQFHTDPDSFSELDVQHAPGNRPAAGARRATPGEVLSQGFQGAQNAGDFLGLDTEFTASFDPSQVPSDAGLGVVGAPTSAPSAYDSEAQQGAPLQGQYEASSESASAFEYGQDLGEELEDYGDGFEVRPEPVASKRPILVALVVAVVGFGAVFFGGDLWSRFKGESGSRVAKAPVQPPRPANPAAGIEPVDVASPTGVTETDPVVTSDPLEVSDPQALAPLPEVARIDPPESVPSTPSTRPTPRSGKTPVVVPPSTTPEPEDPGQETTGSVAGLLPRSGPAPRAFPTLTGADYEWASEDLLELIWRGDSIPMEAIKAPAKTLMPRVGEVRVFTTTGDLFDGRLYAVGQNRVWIDTEPGRVGLDGDRVERIEVMLAAAPREGGERAVPGRRVRVRVPGGMLFGNVLKAEGQEVMLQLEDGGKVRVRGEDIEELGSGRAIVVGR